MGQQQIKILLIEDNPGDARLMSEMLSESGTNAFELEWCKDLASGLQRLEAGDIGLLLLDLGLPDSHGLGTFSKAYSQVPHIPIIVLSGLDDETAAIQTVHEGAQDYLVKGYVNSHGLVRAIRYAIERKRTQEQLAQYAEELRSKNDQMEADLDMAREIQVVLLPPQFLAFPRGSSSQNASLHFHRRYLPVTSLGGDFFDVLELSKTQAGLFLCDVMGHGVRSALVTAMMRALVEEPTPLTTDPGKFLSQLNHRLLTILRQAEVPTFASAFYLVTDVVSGQMRYASAGHPPPLHLNRKAGVVQALSLPGGQPGLALGISDEAEYATGQISLAVHDLVVLFTDGLYEVEGPNKEYYGLERFLQAIRKRVHVPPAKLFADVIAEAQQFSVTGGFTDDVCLVGMEVARLGAPPSS
jgi:sigma-B regulation protein RsbU (phosphoserine phosphatase)